MAKTIEQIRLTALEKVVRDGMKSFRDVGEALAAIRDERLYRPEFRSFADYCRERWDLTPSAAWRRIGQAKAAAALPPGSPTPSQRAVAAEKKKTSRARDVSAAPSVRPARKARTVVEAPTRDVDAAVTPRLLVGTLVRTIGALDPKVAYETASPAQRDAIARWAQGFAGATVTAHDLGKAKKAVAAKRAAPSGRANAPSRREVTPMFKQKHRAG